MDPRILRLADVIQYTSLSKATIYRLLRAGRFPDPVKLSRRSVGWEKAAIDQWLDAREPARATSGVGS